MALRSEGDHDKRNDDGQPDTDPPKHPDRVP
jgi:hypothetical protein